MPLHVQDPRGFVVRWFSSLGQNERLIVTLVDDKQAVFVPAPEHLSKHLDTNFLILDRQETDEEIVQAMDMRKPAIYDTPMPWWKRLFHSKTRRQWEESVDVVLRPMTSYRSGFFGAVCYELYVGKYLTVEFLVDRRWFVSYSWVSWPGVREVLQGDSTWKQPIVTNAQVTTTAP